MDILCPKGHISLDADYCTECGAKIVDTPSGLTDVQTVSPLSSITGGEAELCPDCGTRRTGPSAAFCEVCRYNFQTQTSWAVPTVPRDAPPAPKPEAAPATDTPMETSP